MPHPALPPPFLERHGLRLADWQRILWLIERRYPEHVVDHDINQGGCSYTMTLALPDVNRQTAELKHEGTTFVLQLRPTRHALSIETARMATSWFSDLAPRVEEIGRVDGAAGVGLVAYRMTYISGRRLDELQPLHGDPLEPDVLSKYHNLLDDLADFYATAWTKRTRPAASLDPPRCDGRIGSTLSHRLQKLALQLPSAALRRTAAKTACGVAAGALDRLPTVFTHGDLLPSNLLVDERTWHLRGVVDWADSLYGLEHALGKVSTSDTATPRFVYLGEAGSLRRYFWRRLVLRVPELGAGEVDAALRLARVVGILLWHGFAWDDGRLDRVVCAGRDGEEVAFLEAFLNAELLETWTRL